MTVRIPMYPASSRTQCGAECARFARLGREQACFAGAGLPRGYFCSVTPP